MAESALNRCAFNPTSGGTGTWTVSAALSGFRTPANAGATNGDVYYYFAQNTSLTEWEVGKGAYTSAGTTLARTTIIASSNAGAAVNFTNPPDVYIDVVAAQLLPNLMSQITSIDLANDKFAFFDNSAGNMAYAIPNDFSRPPTAGSGISVSSFTVSINTNNAGGVGAYAILKNTSGSTVNFGATASSGIVYAGGSTSDAWESNAVAPSGTWRLMNGQTTSGNLANNCYGLWMRTA